MALYGAPVVGGGGGMTSRLASFSRPPSPRRLLRMMGEGWARAGRTENRNLFAGTLPSGPFHSASVPCQ